MKANQFLRRDDGYTNLIPLVLAIVIAFAVIYVGSYINGTISEELKDDMVGRGNSYGAYYNQTDPIGNMTINRLNNTSLNWDSALDIVQVTIIIMVLATAIGAIFLFTKFR